MSGRLIPDDADLRLAIDITEAVSGEVADGRWHGVVSLVAELVMKHAGRARLSALRDAQEILDGAIAQFNQMQTGLHYDDIAARVSDKTQMAVELRNAQAAGWEAGYNAATKQGLRDAVATKAVMLLIGDVEVVTGDATRHEIQHRHLKPTLSIVKPESGVTSVIASPAQNSQDPPDAG